MKKKEIITLREKSNAELEKLAHEYRTELEGLRMHHAAGKAKNVHAMRGLKKDIARVCTFLNARSHKADS